MSGLRTGRFVDAYEVLGVAPDAEQDTLKAAHRALARRHHPDLHPPGERDAATRRIKEINVAYGLVRDPESRASYDRLRKRLRAQHAAAGAAQRAGQAVAGADPKLARQWDAMLTAAGRWSGRWWTRHQGGLRRAGLHARRAGLDLVGRVLWLALTAVGGAVGFVALGAVQRLTGSDGVLGPLAGALGGMWLGSFRGWCLRLRLAGLGDPLAERRGTLARLVAVALLTAGALALDTRIAWL